MAKYRGTIKKNDIEGGIWELHTEDGERYQLRGGSNDLRVSGQKVQIEGKVDQGGFGIGMTGPILDVSFWKAL
ncbi:MAG: DUF5818 domain-containing protein [Proteobacteria bacterium]|nr:DUF5818 domain-containing protein [Pseudomonadota bacterium]